MSSEGQTAWNGSGILQPLLTQGLEWRRVRGSSEAVPGVLFLTKKPENVDNSVKKR